MDKRGLAPHICALCAAAGLTLGVANVAAAAPNLVVNGGFESGTNFDTGWTPGGDTSNEQQICPGGPDPDVFQGNCSAAFSTVGVIPGSPASLAQNLALSVGSSYDVSFALEAFGDNPSFFMATLGSQTLLNRSNSSLNTGGAFQVFTFHHLALASSEALVFTALDDPGAMFLDAVSVSAASVPEPASLALLGIGLAGVAASRRRKLT